MNKPEVTGESNNHFRVPLYEQPTTAGYLKKPIQPNEAMDISLQLLATGVNTSPASTNTSSSSCSSTHQQTHTTPTPTNNNNEYFPSAGTMTHSAQSGMSSTEEEAVTSDNVHRLWKRKYHRHAKPDTNAPLKPPSAYVMFSNDVRAELKQQNKSFTDLAKIIGDRWKNITPEEKELYEVNALKSREEYLKQIEEYHQTEDYRVIYVCVCVCFYEYANMCVHYVRNTSNTSRISKLKMKQQVRPHHIHMYGLLTLFFL